MRLKAKAIKLPDVLGMSRRDDLNFADQHLGENRSRKSFGTVDQTRGFRTFRDPNNVGYLSNTWASWASQASKLRSVSGWQHWLHKEIPESSLNGLKSIFKFPASPLRWKFRNWQLFGTMNPRWFTGKQVRSLRQASVTKRFVQN